MGRVTKNPPLMSAKARRALLAEVVQAADEARGVNWQAYTALKRQQAELERENRVEREASAAAKRARMPTVTPAQAEEQLLRLIEAAPRATKYAIYRQLSEIPGFRAAVEGDDEEEEDGPPGALVVHDGGRAK